MHINNRVYNTVSEMELLQYTVEFGWTGPYREVCPNSNVLIYPTNVEKFNSEKGKFRLELICSIDVSLSEKMHMDSLLSTLTGAFWTLSFEALFILFKRYGSPPYYGMNDQNQTHRIVLTRYFVYLALIESSQLLSLKTAENYSRS